MTERMIKKALDFLIENYGFLYDHHSIKNYYGPCPMNYYCYYNKAGCFSIAYLSYGDEVTYLIYDSLDSLKDSHHVSYTGGYNFNNEKDRKEYKEFINEKLKHIINIRECEPEIWKKNKIKLFFGRYRVELKLLAEVIQIQIDKHGEFFGIKV